MSFGYQTADDVTTPSGDLRLGPPDRPQQGGNFHRGDLVHWPRQQGARISQAEMSLPLIADLGIARLALSLSDDGFGNISECRHRPLGLARCLKHAFRNALILIVTAIGILLSTAIGGSVVIEQVFALPGVGRLVVQGILARDYPLVQGVMLIYGFAFVLINLAVDLIYTFADPRVRYD
jgi:hypothetical protein